MSVIAGETDRKQFRLDRKREIGEVAALRKSIDGDLKEVEGGGS